MFEIQLISAAETWPLRHKILRPHQDLQSSIFPQDEWPTTFHVGARSKGQIVGVATFHEEVFPQIPAQMPYRLRGMATDVSFHGQGVGRLVLEKGIQELKIRGCDLLWCNARKIAFPFYEKLGLTYLEPMFDIPTLGPHKVMYKYLR
ncbi:MAG: GNAT family N-acetyltransferase [Pseudobdellovibrionaceae bacterium]